MSAAAAYWPVLGPSRESGLRSLQTFRRLPKRGAADQRRPICMSEMAATGESWLKRAGKFVTDIAEFLSLCLEFVRRRTERRNRGRPLAGIGAARESLAKSGVPTVSSWKFARQGLQRRSRGRARFSPRLHRRARSG